jgi:hypothetical protein
MNRRSVLIRALAGTALLLLSVVSPLCWRSQFNPEPLYDRIECDQTLDKAISEAGFKPGDYRTNATVTYRGVWVGPPHPRRSQCQAISWQFDRAEVIAYVDDDGVVVDKEMMNGFRGRRMPWDYLTDAVRALDRVSFDWLRSSP